MREEERFVYSWEMDFKDGRYKQNAVPKINPNDPPPRLGPALCIRLLPRADRGRYPKVEVMIPPGTRPVYHRLPVRELGTDRLEHLKFRIGWRVGRSRSMLEIDMETLVVRLVTDNEGPI